MLHQTPKVKKEVLKCLAYIIGHLQGVNNMVVEDKYCIDVVKQIQAIQSALNKVTEVVLEDHLKTCVSHAIKKGEGHSLIKEVMETIKQSKNK
ncbi:MAG: metal-sensitive transcriptional regulator [Candidatus Melainabacteria bacterium]|nr:metal-sensitive transcriptional regulator [Candidatus Melainabacteria bacterium]